MGLSIAEILLGLVAILFLYLYKKSQRPKNYPPGPRRLPVIGNLHNLSEPGKDFMKMGQKFGDIIAIGFGPYPAIVLNSFSVIKEALAEPAFTGRPKFELLLKRTGGKPRGVIFQDGIDWVEQRRFILKNLRDFGFGTKSMESLVQEEVKELIETFKESAHAGTPITTPNKFNAAVMNALWSIVSGQRYSHSDPILGTLIKQFTSTNQQPKGLLEGLMVQLFFQYMREVLPNSVFGGISQEERRRRNRQTLDSITDAVENHIETFQENSPRDFIDVYLSEIAKTENKKSSFYGQEGGLNLEYVMLDLFVAGVETTSTTLTWEFLLLSLHDEVQDKLFKEISEVVGLSRLPSLADKPLMPYTEAVIMEVMRFGAINPLAILHRTTEDVVFRGYFIPKDTLVIPNLYGVLHDPKVWGDPDNFRPERFLNADGSKVIKQEEFVPFSIGRRVCLGESLARDELFLFTTSLFQRFDVKPDPNLPRPKIEYYGAPVLIPNPHHQLILRDRFEEH